MTPDCTVCGQVVEFVRTCYQGQWQLFANAPGIVTPGRYVRAPVGTPHYPGFHNFWSRDWVDNAYDPPAPPQLGDVTPLPRLYDKGVPSLAYPPAVTLGTADCLSNGEQYPPTAGRVFYDGFDSQCWLSQGQATPFPVPLLWWKPEGFNPQVNNSSVINWPSGGSNNTPLNAAGFLFPPYVIRPWSNTQPALQFLLNRLYNLTTPVHLGNSFSVYCVFESNTGGTAGFPGLVGPSGDPTKLCYWNNNTLYYQDSLNLHSRSFFPSPGVPSLIDIQRQPTQLLFKIRATVEFNLPLAATGTAIFGGITYDSLHHYPFQIAEIIVFAPVLTTVQDGEVRDYLVARYGLT